MSTNSKGCSKPQNTNVKYSTATGSAGTSHSSERPNINSRTSKQTSESLHPIRQGESDLCWCNQTEKLKEESCKLNQIGQWNSH